jgi:hypothetical protein
VLAALVLLTPAGCLVGLAAIVPFAAAWVIGRRNARAREQLGLAAPPARSRLLPVLLVAVPILIAVAAMQPVLSSHKTRRVRTDAQAMFVFDISRSMLASPGLNAQTRLARARSIAIQLRDNAIPDVPSGISTLTTILLPHVVPDDSLAVFNSSVRESVNDEDPPPPAVGIGLPGTSFSALSPVRDQGYFDPSSKHRVVILLTDGESGPYDPQSVADSLVGPDEPDGLTAGVTAANQAPVQLVVIRVGGSHDRIHDPDGGVESTYEPDPRAPELVATLVSDTHGYTFTASQTGSAAKRLRSLFGSGPTKQEGVSPTTVALAPYLVALACLAVLGVLWKRNTKAL